MRKTQSNCKPTNPKHSHTHFFGMFSNDFVVLITHCRLTTENYTKQHSTHFKTHTHTPNTLYSWTSIGRTADCGLRLRWINGWGTACGQSGASYSLATSPSFRQWDVILCNWQIINCVRQKTKTNKRNAGWSKPVELATPTRPWDSRHLDTWPRCPSARWDRGTIENRGER